MPQLRTARTHHSNTRAQAEPYLATVGKAKECVVVLLAFDGFQSLDVSGPFEVFQSANARRPRSFGGYRVIIASRDGGDVRANSGLSIANTVAIAELPASIDTVLIAGGDDDRALAVGSDPATAEWMNAMARSARRWGSVCTGAFALGAMGLLDGRRVTSHWASCERLARLFPRARVDANALFIEDRGLHSSAGVTAGMDLALAMVEKDLGTDVAHAVARHLILFLRRPGGQSQLSAALAAQAGNSDRIRELLAWIAEHANQPMSIPLFAERMNTSERSVTRHFRVETGMTPMEFVASVRLDRARALLEETDWSIERIAMKSGFGSADTMQRAFVRRLGLTPREWRNRISPEVRPHLDHLASPA
ncbi:MAG: helix-turn-helix domain-containing protein [Burkholderiaceae bacterium]|jgi:transcriptional regulator GlxA family with amidase domain